MLRQGIEPASFQCTGQCSNQQGHFNHIEQDTFSGGVNDKKSNQKITAIVKTRKDLQYHLSLFPHLTVEKNKVERKKERHFHGHTAIKWQNWT